jgi:hypothetical protein
VEEHQPVGGLRGERHVVGDQGDRDALLLLQPPQHAEHLGSHRRVQRGGDLVAQQQLRPHHQRPGDRDPLPLTTGQLRGARHQVLLHAHLGQRHLGAVAGLGGRHAQLLARRQGEIVQHVHVRPQGVGLEDHADLLVDLAPLLGPLLLLEHDLAVECDGAVVRLGQAGQRPQQRGLAGPGLADDDGDVPDQHVEVDVLEDGPSVEGLLQAAGGHQHLAEPAGVGGGRPGLAGLGSHTVSLDLIPGSIRASPLGPVLAPR